MKGMIFTEFLEMVEERFGIEVVDAITVPKSGGCPMGFTSVGNYPHGTLVEMVVALHERTGLELPLLLKTFGAYLYSTFQRKFPQFLEGHKDPLDILEGIETTIHSEVRKLYPEARLPQFQCERLNPNTLVMEYESKRPFADVADGLIQACIDSLDTRVKVNRTDHDVSEGSKSTFTLTR